MLDWNDFLLVMAVAIVFALIWFAIHIILWRKQRNGKILSAKEQEWLSISKFAGYFFLILPVIIIPLLWVSDIVFNVILGIFATLALLSMLAKKVIENK